MSDFDDLFDKKYGERMREQTDRDFSDTDWQALSGRLDEADGRRRRAIPLAWLGLLGGLLLLSNLIWFAKFSALERGFKDFGLREKTAHDTVFQQTTERRVDTVFQKQVQFLPVPTANVAVFPKKRDALATATETQFLAELDRRFPGAIDRFLGKNVPHKTDSAENNPSPPTAIFGENDPDVLAIKAAGKPRPDLPKIGQRNPCLLQFGAKPLIFLAKTIENADLDETTPVDKKRGSLKNDWWMTSYSGGWMLPVSDDLTRRNGYSVGAQLEYGFAPNRSLWAEFSQTGMTCTGNKTDDYGLEVPYKHDFRVAQFETAKGPKISNRIGLGARLRQDDGKKWGRLGIGIGYVWEYPAAYNLFIDWENTIDPNQHVEEYLTVPKEGYAIGYLHGDIGIEWRLGPSWLASVTAWKEMKGHFKYGMPGYFGAKAGLAYKF